jgi:rhamnogalacturonan endolyase
MNGLYSAKGEKISDRAPRTCDFTVYWDGDLQQELLDRNFVAKYNWKKDSLEIIMQDRQCRAVNGTKATPVLSADLFGDWREEIVWRTADNTALRIYSTTIPTQHRLVTFMHDPVYRLGIAWQNVAYNQPPTTSYYIGDDMKEAPKPNIYVVKYKGDK